MKKPLLFIITLLILISCFLSIYVYAEEFIDKSDPKHIDKILATDLSTISKEQFYQCEFAIMSGFSGSGGYSLDEPLIEWLRKAENAFKVRGIKIKDEYNRHFAFADSYFNHEMYEKALEEFNNIKDQAGIELVEWFISNKGIKNGIVKIKEYPGRIPWKSSEITKAENKQYLFVAYFKGPVYKYDKKRKMHALIYAPLSQYDWCDALTFDGNNLVIKLRDNAGTFIFDNEKQRISQLAEGFDVDISEITVFFGPDFYELSPIIDNLKLSPDRTKIAFTVWDKSENVYNNLGIAYIDGSERNLLVKAEVDNFAWLNNSEIIYELQGSKKFQIFNIDGKTRDSNIKADFTESFEIPEIVKTRLNDFVEAKYRPHYGVLGGRVNYSVKNYIPSLDKTKIAFLVEGGDGHREFYPAWHVCSYKGGSITLIDSTARYMSSNVVWLSDNEVVYVKDARLWKAVIK